MITEIFTGTEAISSTEWSLTTDTSGPDTATNSGCFQTLLDLSDMIAGDEIEIKIYEKVQSTDSQKVIYQSNLVGPQSPPVWVSPSLILLNGWDVTLKTISGGTITVNWSIRKAG